MFSLIYLSRATDRLTDEELLDLLATARRNNERHAITGLLLYKDGNFMQLLEGEEATVRNLFETIANDLRHCNVTVLIEEVRDQRQFPEWSMGFQDLKSVDVKTVPGYSDFFSVPLVEKEFSGKPSRGQELLLLFRKIG